MSDNERRLADLKAAVDRDKIQRATAENDKARLKGEWAQLKAELEALNLTPETLEPEIARLEQEENSLLDQAEKLKQEAA